MAETKVKPAEGSNPYCFRAYDSGGTTLTDATHVRINLATEVYDLNGDFASSIYTVPVDGVYHFDACFWISGAVATGVLAYAELYVNGAEAVRGESGLPSSNGGFGVHTDLQLAAGDTVEFYGIQDSAGSEATVASQARTYFSGHLITQTG